MADSEAINIGVLAERVGTLQESYRRLDGKMEAGFEAVRAKFDEQTGALRDRIDENQQAIADKINQVVNAFPNRKEFEDLRNDSRRGLDAVHESARNLTVRADNLDRRVQKIENERETKTEERRPWRDGLTSSISGAVAAALGAGIIWLATHH